MSKKADIIIDLEAALKMVKELPDDEGGEDGEGYKTCYGDGHGDCITKDGKHFMELRDCEDHDDCFVDPDDTHLCIRGEECDHDSCYSCDDAVLKEDVHYHYNDGCCDHNGWCHDAAETCPDDKDEDESDSNDLKAENERLKARVEELTNEVGRLLA